MQDLIIMNEAMKPFLIYKYFIDQVSIEKLTNKLHYTTILFLFNYDAAA